MIKMTVPDFNMLLCGVGGQGLVLLSNVIGTACTGADLRVITGEQHGLSQRSGTISIHLRIGAKVRSPLIPVGGGDILLSLEALEALRYIEYLKDGGIIVINSRILHPISETDALIKDSKKTKPYFGITEIENRLKQVTGNVLFLDALALAKEAGNPLTENIVLLGAVSAFKAFPVSPSDIKSAIEKLVPPAARIVNLKAFELGAKASHVKFCGTIACRDI